MRTPNRKAVEPSAKFARNLIAAKKSGRKLIADEITITPPKEKNKYWTLRASFRNVPKERSARDTLGDVNAAFLDLKSELESLRSGSEGLPENAHHQLADVIDRYILQAGPKHAWRGKTPQNRKEDFAHLIAISRVNKYKCSEFNASIMRTYLSKATASSKRAKGLTSAVKTFVKWGSGTGYFTVDQQERISRVVWEAPKGVAYKAAPSRREQSKLYFGTEDSHGGQVPTHDQVLLIASELQKLYKFGEAFVHVSANLGSRANETLIFTASRKTFENRRGNYVDIQDEAVRVHWQYERDKADKSFRVTKNNKFRSVVIPSVDIIETNFDVLGWLAKRSKDSLQEQLQGTNPLALIFPNARGEVIKLNSFNSDKMRPALEALGWKMPAIYDAKGKARYMYRFTIHSFRDRYGTTAADEWGYSERQLLEQGSWSDPETVRKFYLGTTDDTYQSVRDLHKKNSRAIKNAQAS